MAEDSEVMMPMSSPAALQHIEITVLRQMGENIAAQTRHLEDLGRDVKDVRERVIRIEATELGKELDQLSARVAALEAAGQKMSGITAFGSWLVQCAPWLIAAFSLVAAVFGFGKK